MPCCVPRHQSVYLTVTPRHGSTATIDYRIRYHFQPEPTDPFPMARDGIWSVICVDDLADILRRTPERFPDYALTALGNSPKRAGNWQHFLGLGEDQDPCTV